MWLDAVRGRVEFSSHVPCLADTVPVTILLMTGATNRECMQNDMMKAALLALPSVRALASEEDDDAVLNSASASGGDGDGDGFAVVFDPLDGSRNIEVSIPTGTIFGIYSCVAGACPATHI